MKVKTDNFPYKGQCLCGLVKYEVDEIEPHIAHCHCSMCRKFHGSAFSTFVEVKLNKFRWVNGKNNLKTYLAPNGTKRQFCENCGSSLIFISSDSSGESIEFSLGTLDSEIELKPDAHVFTNYSVNWYEVNDGLPKYKEGRGSE